MTTTTTKTLNTTLKRITATTLALVLAITLTPTPSAYAATTDGASLSAATVATQAKTKLAAKNVTASTLSYTGKALKPKVTVKVDTGKTTTKWIDDDGDGEYDKKDVPVYKTLKQGRDYTLTVKNASGKTVKKPKAKGTYKAIVKGKGSYTGTVTKKFKVAKETMYIMATAKTKSGIKRSGTYYTWVYNPKFKVTSNTTGVLSLKGKMTVVPASMHKKVKFYDDINRLQDELTFFDARKMKKKVKAKSFTLTSATKCYVVTGDNNGYYDDNAWRRAGREATLCRDNVKNTSFEMIIVERDGKVIKLGVTTHKSSWSNGYGW